VGSAAAATVGPAVVRHMTSTAWECAALVLSTVLTAASRTAADGSPTEAVTIIPVVVNTAVPSCPTATNTATIAPAATAAPAPAADASTAAAAAAGGTYMRRAVWRRGQGHRLLPLQLLLLLIFLLRRSGRQPPVPRLPLQQRRRLLLLRLLLLVLVLLLPGPGRYCSPRHRMLCDSMLQGSTYVPMKWRATYARSYLLLLLLVLIIRIPYSSSGRPSAPTAAAPPPVFLGRASLIVSVSVFPAPTHVRCKRPTSTL